MSADRLPATLLVSARIVHRLGARALDVAFEAPAGITALVGPSGAGKSTTLAAIAGLLKPDAGRIAVAGETWFDSATNIDLAVRHRRIAFVFQSLALFPHLTAAQNVAYGLERDGSRSTRERQVDRWLERFRIRHLAERKPRTFSGGEAQRVALARALARTPRVVLLDEPFTALDRALRQELAHEVRDLLLELGVPVVLVTHDGDEARSMSDRFVLLNRGRVASTGPIGELSQAEETSPGEDSSEKPSLGGATR
jgi:molybdate transport system ATP-binding protein